MTTEQAMLLAADKMKEAAMDMKVAAREIDFALGNHQRFLKDWLEQFQNSLSDISETLGNFDVEGLPVRIVGNSVEVEEDRHEATTVPAPADQGPLELEGEAG